MQAAVIGLGAIGSGAATSLLRAGIETIGCDLVEEARERFIAAGGQAVETPEAAVAKADVVLVFVVNAAQARSVLFGTRGAVSAARLGAVFVLCATMPPAETKRLAADLTAAGMGVIDAPLSGVVAQAETGELTVLASGAPGAFDKAGAALDAIARRVFRLGDEPGVGSQYKMVAQVLTGVHTAALAEAMVLAADQGLDLATVSEIFVGAGADGRSTQIATGAYAVLAAVDTLVKDLGIAAAEADAEKLPLSHAALTLFEAAAAEGLGQSSDATVAQVLAKRAGVTLP